MSIAGDDYDAFVSYFRSDAAEVRRLADALASRHQLRIWWDRERLLPGEVIADALARAIAKSRTFVLIVSRSALSSGWVQLEYNVALSCMIQHGKPERVIPVILGEANIPPVLSDRVAVRALDLHAEKTVDEIAHGIRGSSNPEVLTRAKADDNAAIVNSAKQSLIVVGHTLMRFLSDLETRQSLESAVNRGVHLTLMLQNPNSRFVDAYGYERILRGVKPPAAEIDDSLSTLRTWLDSLRHSIPINKVRIVLTNHMPSHRAIVVDDRACYLGLYLFARDVSQNPTLHLDANGADYEQEWYRAIRASLGEQIHAPDSIDLVRDGAFDERWRKRHIASYDRWDLDKKRRYLLTWHFYRKEAHSFRGRFGKHLETYVRSYLDNFKGCRRVLVVGCGSGKEIKHLLDLGVPMVIGSDFSSVALDLAREELVHYINRVGLRNEDFYDLALDDGEPYEGLVANAALVHLLERNDLKSTLEAFFARLVPGGLCFVRLLHKMDMESGEEEQGRFGSTRWFTYFDSTTLRQTAREVGFIIDEAADRAAAEADDMSVESIVAKGFRHAEFARVSWPTVLMRKPLRTG